MKLHLIDSDAAVALALQAQFGDLSDVSVAQGDLLKAAEGCIVSPANGYGFMDGGIDKAYVSYFGAEIQRRVITAIASRPEGHLPVGASMLVPTGHAVIRFLLLAPTMVTPEFIPAENAYRAMRAVLRLADQYSEKLAAIYCPGLGTGVGGLSPSVAADQMASAYRDFLASNR